MINNKFVLLNSINFIIQPYIKSKIKDPFTKTPNQVLKLLLTNVINENQEVDKKVKCLEEQLKHAVAALHENFLYDCSTCKNGIILAIWAYVTHVLIVLVKRMYLVYIANIVIIICVRRVSQMGVV